MASPATPDESPGYTLADLVEALWRYRLVVMAVSVIAVTATAAYAWMARPVYRAEVVMVPVEQEPAGGLASMAGRFGGLATLAGIDLGSGSQRDETLAILKSNAFLTRFIEERKLLPILFASRWDASRQAWRDPEDAPTMGDGLWKLRRNVLGVGSDESGSLVRLRIDWYDPEVAADWANDLVARLNDATRQDALERAQRSIGYLNRELEKQSVIEVRQAIYRLLEGQIKNAMLANVNRDFSMRVIDRAVPADPDRFVRPKRWLLVALSLLGGLALGAAIAVVLDARRRARNSGAS